MWIRLSRVNAVRYAFGVVLLGIGLACWVFVERDARKFDMRVNGLLRKHDAIIPFTRPPDHLLTNEDKEWLQWTEKKGGAECGLFARTFLECRDGHYSRLVSVDTDRMREEIIGRRRWQSWGLILAGLIVCASRRWASWKSGTRSVCRGCGYDLRGQVTPRCPECGLSFHPVPVEISPSHRKG